MSSPRTKRQFAGAASDPSQRQITAFFSATSAREPGAPGRAPSPPQSTPSLPAYVQSSLLNVGMRVRKSVPEGYKTGTNHRDSPKFCIDTPHTPNIKAILPPPSSQRELVPFCGLNRIGGMDVQSLPEEEEIEMPGLTSSQQTVESMDSVESRLTIDTGRTRKRFFDEEDATDEPVQVWRDRDAWLDGEISPRTTMPNGWGNARAMAVPRTRGRKSPPQLDAVGQENRALDDFGDAAFLDERAWSKELDMNDA